LPAKLTPEAVREMLAKVRIESAAQRRGALEGVRRARKAETAFAVGAGVVTGAAEVPYFPGAVPPSSVAGAYGGGVPAGGFAPVAQTQFAPRRNSPSGRKKTRRRRRRWFPRRHRRRRRRSPASTRTEGASGWGSARLRWVRGRSRERPRGRTDSLV
jgi:hypothetical protein